MAVFLVENGADPNDVYTDDKGKQHNLLYDSVTLGNEVRIGYKNASKQLKIAQHTPELRLW